MAWIVRSFDDSPLALVFDGDAERARISLEGGAACVTFKDAPAFDSVFGIEAVGGIDAAKQRAVGYVRGIERAVGIYRHRAPGVLFP